MNTKTILTTIGILALLVAGLIALRSETRDNQSVADPSYKGAEYVIDGQPVKIDGDVTRYFGNDLAADLDADGRDDIAFLITRQPGGSGTFFYVVAALNAESGYVGSEAYLLGDRIAPQTVELSRNPSHRGVIVVNYADRAPGEPMTAQPSVGKSVWLKLDADTRQFGVVEQNFEGEADPSRMSLTMKDWTWVSALYNDGRSIEPRQAEKFVLAFAKDGRFSATTDCNRMSGSYTADGDSVSFSQVAMTKMFCEGSQEQDFLDILEGAQRYHFTSRGELILELKFDSGTATFK